MFHRWALLALGADSDLGDTRASYPAATTTRPTNGTANGVLQPTTSPAGGTTSGGLGLGSSPQLLLPTKSGALRGLTNPRPGHLVPIHLEIATRRSPHLTKAERVTTHGSLDWNPLA